MRQIIDFFGFEHPSLLLIPTALHVAVFVMVCVHCLKGEQRDPASALLWMFLAWSFPVIGPLLYIFMGIDRVPQKAWLKQSADRRFLSERRSHGDALLPTAYWRSVHEQDSIRRRDCAFTRINEAMESLLEDYPLLGGNSVKPLLTGDEAYPAMLAAIESATRHVHLQSFIIRNDRIGVRFMDLLAEKARSGVTVRLMYDRFGSTHAVMTGLFLRYRRVPNMRIQGWTQADPMKRQFQINLRNHRKSLIVDGHEAFVGGINLQAQHSTHKGRPPIRDYHFQLKGPIVMEIQYAFLRDWHFMTDDDPKTLLLKDYFPTAEPAGKALVRAIHSGPTQDEKEAFIQAVFLCLVSARKQILIVTPYFAPPPDISRAIRTAALGGLDVRLVVPMENNHLYAGLAGQARYETLLEAGARIFERKPPFLHAKAMLVDDEFALVGTGNLDMRSLRLNYETNLLVSDNAFCSELKRAVLDDMGMSEEIALAEWRRRPSVRRMAENFCGLLSPII